MAKAKADTSSENAGGMSKMKMVEMAIDQLGNASPRDIQNEIRDKHGVEISTTMISSYKSNILKKQGGGGGGRSGGAGDATVGVKDITAIRDLIDRVGASELQTLIKVLSK